MSARRDTVVRTYPGVPHDEVLRVLQWAHTAVGNVRGRTHDPIKVVDFYLEWADEAARMLRYAVHAEDINRLILTRRYWAIYAAPGVHAARSVYTEIDDRNADLEAAVSQLQQTRDKWNRSEGKLVVADTSVFCQHPDKLVDIDLAEVLGLRETPVRLMLPVLVLDELDNLKQSKDGHARWRAGHTLGRLDEVLDANGAGLLRKEDYRALDSGGIPRGPVYVEVFFDPPGHQPLPINDDEIIDRALAIQTEAGREVTFLTYDTGQSTRARFAGLTVRKLSQDLGPEPARQGS